MPKQFTQSVELVGDVETAFAANTSEAWVLRKAERLKDGSQVVSRTATPDGGVELVMSRALPEGIPSALSRFLPRDGRVVQTDCWGPAGADGVRRGTWAVDSPGLPADVHGEMRLEPTGSGCRQVVEGTVKVSIPVIAGRVEGLLVGMSTKAVQAEGAVLAELVVERQPG